MSSTLIIALVILFALAVTFVLGEWLVRRRAHIGAEDDPAYPSGLPYDHE